jgi:hypothetical protein
LCRNGDTWKDKSQLQKQGEEEEADSLPSHVILSIEVGQLTGLPPSCQKAVFFFNLEAAFIIISIWRKTLMVGAILTA